MKSPHMGLLPHCLLSLLSQSKHWRIHAPPPQLGPNSFMSAYVFTEKCLRRTLVPSTGLPPMANPVSAPGKICYVVFGSFGLSTKEPYTILLCRALLASLVSMHISIGHKKNIETSYLVHLHLFQPSNI